MSHTPLQSRAGFTLIELLVTISIIILVTGIALTRYASFNSTVLLNNEAYEVALDIRRAQAYGLSASGFGSGNFRNPYGVCFHLSDPGQYFFFQDADADGRCDEEEILETVKLDPRFELSEVCAANDCQTTGRVSVFFKRPNFIASFWSNWGDNTPSSIKVRLSEAKGDDRSSRTIVVESTGYISVQSE